MKIARGMVAAALMTLVLSGCGENEFPTEPIKAQSASAQTVSGAADAPVVQAPLRAA